MAKVTLDMDTFKALASNTRLDILKTLDGKKMSLKDISAITKLNKATLHEHLAKLNEAGLVKRKEREGHKFVSYKLTWKGESLLHPENTRIVVMFTTTFIALAVGIVQMAWYVKGTVINLGYKAFNVGNEVVMTTETEAMCFDDILSRAGKNVYDTSGLPEFLQPPVGQSNNFLRNLLNAKSSVHGQAPISIPYSDQSQNYSWVGTSSDGIGSLPEEGARLVVDESQGIIQAIYQNPMFLYVSIACFAFFIIVLSVALWRLWENKTPKL